MEERNLIEEVKKKLESEKVRFEIELLDVIEIREVLEGELFCFRFENGNVLWYGMEG